MSPLRTTSPAPIQTTPSQSAAAADLDAVRNWMELFSAAVRDVDYERGRELFASDVFAFGTRIDSASGIDSLVAQQWTPLWSNTRGYTFDFDQLHAGVSGDLAWAAAPWHSQGKSAAGTWYHRHGRATFILQRRNGRWLAIHSHHSLTP